MLASFSRIPSTRKSVWSESEPRMKTETSEPGAPFANDGRAGDAAERRGGRGDLLAREVRRGDRSTAVPSVRNRPASGSRRRRRLELAARIGLGECRRGQEGRGQQQGTRRSAAAEVNGFIRMSFFTIAMKFSRPARAIAPGEW